MSDFLEQVFAAQALEVSPRRRRRKLDEGFAGRRYVVMLTVMASLTAVPTWIMLRAGANGLGQPVAAASVQPLLVPHIDLGVPASAPPEAQSPPAVAQRVPHPPPAQEQPQAAPPVLEGQSYVDTGSRPVQKRRPSAPTKPKAPPQEPLAPPASATPSQAPVSQAPPTRAPVVPALTPPADLTPPTVRPTRTRIAERPQVIAPEPPQLKDFRARS
jgi:hypothetical protein